MDKFPVQATQVEEDGPSLDMASMATSAQYRYSKDGSSIPTTPYSFSESGMTYESSVPSTSFYSKWATNYSFDASSSHSSIQTDARSTQSAMPPRYENYMKNDSRLATFNSPKWLVNEKPNKFLLAEQGFFFTGRGDLVRCYQCGIGLKDWIRSDDVMSEHRKYSPTCSLLLQKTQTPDGNSGNSPVGTGNQTSYKVRSPQYQTMESRIKSFDRFPSIIGIPPQQLAVAGLFFTGDGDLCRCFTCDGGLKDWSSGDDPCKEHATYFPKCSYINQLKGADCVREMQRRRENNMQSTDATSGSSTQTSTATTSTSTSTSSLANLSIPSMDGHNISGNLNSSSIDSQVKEMGFSDTQVENARAELRRRGVANPSVEALMNAILDMPETTNASEETANSRQETSNARQDTTNSRQSTTNTTSEGELRPKDLRKLAEENQQLSKQVQCMLCVKEEPDILFLPCAHHRICHNCSERISRCPQCNTVIKEKVRTYRA